MGFVLSLVGWMMCSDRVGMQSMRSSDHWAWSQGLWAAGCVFFGKEGITE